MSCVYVLTRMQNENIFFAGGFGSVSVVYFDEVSCKLTVIKNFDDIMSDEIMDLKFYHNVLYALSPAQEEIAKLEFFFGEKSDKQTDAYNKSNETTDYLRQVTSKYNISVEKLPGNNFKMYPFYLSRQKL